MSQNISGDSTQTPEDSTITINTHSVTDTSKTIITSTTSKVTTSKTTTTVTVVETIDLDAKRPIRRPLLEEEYNPTSYSYIYYHIQPYYQLK